jgi:hypothetical protein
MSDQDPELTKPVCIAGVEIPAEHQSDLVLLLVGLIQKQATEIQQLKDEIQRLKGTTRRPRIKPSVLLKDDKKKNIQPPGKRSGSDKRSKTKDIRIDQDVVLPPTELPPGSVLEGYRDFVVQDLIIKGNNTRYRRAVYRLPDGTLLVGPRAEGVKSHFGPGLCQYILLQAHQNHVTQNRILEQLRDLGIDISAGQISNILLNGHECFHDEKDQLLPAAREVSDHLHCDDTSARHQGKAAVCTHIGNEMFASFSTTDSKSRLNFLRLLCQGDDEQYRWCEESVESLRAFGVSKKLMAQMSGEPEGVWQNRAAWEQQLEKWRLSPKDQTRVSEAALCGKLLTEAWYSRIGLVSDDAPQFKLFGLIHGLCWVHGERKIDRLIPLTASHRRAKEQSQQQFWNLYASLKDYRESPTEQQRIAIGSRFDAMCSQKTGYGELNEALGLLGAKREEFLAVLEHPQLPLHNNLSENDIREYARLRKISGGTRSDLGRRCRDTFMSLKKTCRKLGVSFGAYLADRLSEANQIPPLVDLIRRKAIDDSPESISSTV